MTAQYLRTQARRMAAAYQPPATDGIRKPSPDMCLTVYDRGPDLTPAQVAAATSVVARQPDAALLADILGLDLGVA